MPHGFWPSIWLGCGTARALPFQDHLVFLSKYLLVQHLMYFLLKTLFNKRIVLNIFFKKTLEGSFSRSIQFKLFKHFPFLSFSVGVKLSSPHSSPYSLKIRSVNGTKSKISLTSYTDFMITFSYINIQSKIIYQYNP